LRGRSRRRPATRRRAAALLALAVAVAAPSSALGQEDDDGLSEVSFQTRDADPEAEVVMRTAVAAAWKVLRPALGEHGLTRFPAARFSAYYDSDDAARRSGWAQFREWRAPAGYALPGKAHILIQPNLTPSQALGGSTGLIAHEAAHIAQFAVGGSDLGHYCISEGAAEWYGGRAQTRAGGASFDRYLDGLLGRVAGREGFGAEGLPAFGDLGSQRQFQQTHKGHGQRRYTLCMLAFSLLIEIEGEQAYWNYVSELRTRSWKNAFDRSFAEDYDTFKERFLHYRTTDWTDFRTEREIGRDEFLQEVFACAPWRHLEECDHLAPSNQPPFTAMWILSRAVMEHRWWEEAAATRAL